MTGLFSRKIRGFRVIDMVALGILLVLVLGVYLAKAGAGRERSEIAEVEQNIDAEQSQMRLLNAEVAHLERPSRIERLSTQFLGLQPVPAKHEVTLDALPELARKGAVVKASADRAASSPATASVGEDR